jgi:surface polysaccharide O-acyltransferase-like enzyme
VLRWVSANTLPIYLFHVMLLELIETYLGWRLGIYSLPTILEIPVMTVLTFTVTCLVLYPLLKVPYVKRIIG